MGTALSAPFIVLAVNVGLASMLVLGDGLCPSMALALVIGGLYLYFTSLKRLDLMKEESRGGFDLMHTPWYVIQCGLKYQTFEFKTHSKYKIYEKVTFECSVLE